MDGTEEAILLTLCGQFEYSSYARGIYIFGYDRKSSRLLLGETFRIFFRNLLYIFLIFPSYSLLLFVMLFSIEKKIVKSKSQLLNDSTRRMFIDPILRYTY